MVRNGVLIIGVQNGNAYGYDENADYSGNENLWFQTAWSAPHPILQKLSEMYPDITFEHEWADEDLGANCGRKCYRNGECTEEYYPETKKKPLNLPAVSGTTILPSLI